MIISLRQIGDSGLPFGKPTTYEANEMTITINGVEFNISFDRHGEMQIRGKNLSITPYTIDCIGIKGK